MKSIIAIVLVVAVAVECMPKLLDSVRNRLAILPGKRSESSEEADDKYMYWPYGWFEFSTFVGKCVSIENSMTGSNIQPTKEKDACKTAYHIGEMYMGATEEEKAYFNDFIDKMFKLLQCLNLETERRTVEKSLLVTGQDPKDSLYLMETEPLSDICNHEFKSYKDEVEAFLDDLKTGATLLGGVENTLEAELRRLLMLVSRKVCGYNFIEIL